MKYVIITVGILLILGGIGGIAYDGIRYTTKEQVAQFGDIRVTEEKRKMISVPPVAGGVCIVVGLVLVFLGVRNKSI